MNQFQEIASMTLKSRWLRTPHTSFVRPALTNLSPRGSPVFMIRAWGSTVRLFSHAAQKIPEVLCPLAPFVLFPGPHRKLQLGLRFQSDQQVNHREKGYGREADKISSTRRCRDYVSMLIMMSMLILRTLEHACLDIDRHLTATSCKGHMRPNKDSHPSSWTNMTACP